MLFEFLRPVASDINQSSIDIGNVSGVGIKKPHITARPGL